MVSLTIAHQRQNAAIDVDIDLISLNPSAAPKRGLGKRVRDADRAEGEEDVVNEGNTVGDAELDLAEGTRGSTSSRANFRMMAIIAFCFTRWPRGGPMVSNAAKASRVCMLSWQYRALRPACGPVPLSFRKTVSTRVVRPRSC